jgi:27-O-demethylrifamycin SV methyltransferase
MAEPAAHYDWVTDTWRHLLGDDLHYGLFASTHQALQEATGSLSAAMTRAADLSAGMRVLDVGCGNGSVACELAAHHGVEVVGISPSAVCVERSLEKASSAAAVNATFLRADGQSLPFADDSFDRVWVLESSHLMADKLGLMCESARVLAPSGRLVLCDIVARYPLGIADVLRYRDQFLLLQAVFGRAKMEPVDEYARLAADCGMEVSYREDLTEAVRPTFDRWRGNALASREKVTETLGERGWREFLDACDVMEQLWDEGVLGYALIAVDSRPCS